MNLADHAFPDSSPARPNKFRQKVNHVRLIGDLASRLVVWRAQQLYISPH
jgi:hypothetical protein